MSDDLDEADKTLLQDIAARRKGTEVAFYELDKLLSEEELKSIDESLDTNRTHVTAAVFYRILATDLLPADILYGVVC